MQSYEYDGVAVLNPDTTYSSPAPEYVRASGRGVLPLAIGHNDVRALRDTLQKLACVTVTDDGVATASATTEYTPIPGDTVTSRAESFITTDLSMSMVTPAVAVWRNYTMAYTNGAAHGRYNTNFINYLIPENKILSLDDLLVPGKRGELAEMVRGKLKEYDDLIVPVEKIALPDNFEITQEGIDFVYGIYEIAPYSSGEVNVDFSYYELAEVLRPELLEELTAQLPEN